MNMTIDNIDHDTTNNNISNLRLASRSEQNKYQRKRKNCSSEYIGVQFRIRDNRYEVYVNTYYDGIKTSIYLGSFIDEVIAARVRDEYIIKNNLQDFNLLNFPTGKLIREGKVVCGEFKPEI